MIRRDTDTQLNPLLRRSSPSALDRIVSEMLAEGRHVLIIGCDDMLAKRTEAGGALPVECIQAADQVRAYSTRKLGIICCPPMATDSFGRIWAELQLLNPLAEMRFVEWCAVESDLSGNPRGLPADDTELQRRKRISEPCE